MDTLNEALARLAGAAGGFTFLDGSLRPREVSFAALVDQALRCGAGLSEHGLGRGDCVVLVLPDAAEFVPVFLGALTIGAVPVAAPPPQPPVGRRAYGASLGCLLRAVAPRALVTSAGLEPELESPALACRLGLPLLAGRLAASTRRAHPAPVAPGDLCCLQLTSGSTGAPKAVAVTHANVIASSRAIMVDGLASDPARDRGVTWLPLHHDMGLVGFVLAPLVARVPVVFVPPPAFARRPAVWLEAIDRFRGTITFAPNFAFARLASRPPAGVDLRSLRVAGCGSEFVAAGTLRRFAEVYAPAGLDAAALLPCYGLAEATLAVTFHARGTPLRTLRTEAGVGGMARELVSCGRPFPGHEVEIRGEDGRALPEGEVGEIVTRGPSITPGYFGAARANARLLRGGWLHTGDLGFLREGNLYVFGRRKELIILRGRNIRPDDVEAAVEQVPGVRKGRVVAFALPGPEAEDLVVALEAVSSAPGLEEAVAGAVRGGLGIAPARVVRVPRGTVGRTSSGKLRRLELARRFAAGEFGAADARIGG